MDGEAAKLVAGRVMMMVCELRKTLGAKEG